jgi:superfamily I DNA and/or RNA helicase
LQAIDNEGDASIRRVELIIMEECAQAIEPEADIVIPRFGLPKTTVLMVGDHLQLGPTVALNRKDDEFAHDILSVSLFERLSSPHYHSPTRYRYDLFLEEQNRMNELISDFISDTFYAGRLKMVDTSNKQAGTCPYSWKAVSFLDTTNLSYISHSAQIELREKFGRLFKTEPVSRFTSPFLSLCDFAEKADKLAGGYINEGEAVLVVMTVEKLTAAGIPFADIGVITPYSDQKSAIQMPHAYLSKLESKYWQALKSTPLMGFKFARSALSLSRSSGAVHGESASSTIPKERMWLFLVPRTLR